MRENPEQVFAMHDISRTDGLDRTLGRIVAEQSRSKGDRIERFDNLLHAFREQTPGTIDVAYVMYGAHTYAPETEEALGPDCTTSEFYPHGVLEDGTHLPETRPVIAVTGAPEPSRTLLIVDDAWLSGETKRKADAFFRRQGYRDIWMAHAAGNLGRDGSRDKELGFTFGNPVLLSAKLMLQYFDTVDQEKQEELKRLWSEKY